MSSLSDESPAPELKLEEYVATKPEDGMSAYVANPEGVTWEPPVPEKILTKEEIYLFLDQLRMMEEGNRIALPEEYCKDRGIDYEEYHKPAPLSECVTYTERKRQEKLEKLRKKLADKKKIK
jgi:hypothetical protein